MELYLLVWRFCDEQQELGIFDSLESAEKAAHSASEDYSLNDMEIDLFSLNGGKRTKTWLFDQKELVLAKWCQDQFIVTGTWCEYISTLHITANSREEALAKWHKAFPDSAGMNINVESSPDMILLFWKYDGYSYKSKGYGSTYC